MMEDSIKALRKHSIILKSLQDIFLYDLSSLLSGVLVTVTHVELYNKNQLARVYLTFMPAHDSASIISELERQKKKIRALLAKRLAHKCYTIPQLQFCINDSLERSFYIQKLLNGFDVTLRKYTAKDVSVPYYL